MKSKMVFLIVITLAVSLACQILGKAPGDESGIPTQTQQAISQLTTPTQKIISQPTATTIHTNVPTAEDTHTDFLLILPPDAYDIKYNEDGSVSFLTNIPINGVEYFYKTALTDRGFGVLHGPNLPNPAEGCFKMFFSGDPSGRTMVISGCTIVQTGELSVTIGLQEPDSPGSSTESEENHTDFLLTDDAYKVINNEDGSITFFSNMSFDDVEDFYRQELPLRGYTERIVEAQRPAEGYFQLIFDGDPSGKAMIVSGCIQFQNEEMAVSIQLKDM